MDKFVSAKRTRIAGWAAVSVIVALNAILIGQLVFAN
jgi:manganese transport protein